MNKQVLRILEISIHFLIFHIILYHFYIILGNFVPLTLYI